MFRCVLLIFPNFFSGSESFLSFVYLSFVFFFESFCLVFVGFPCWSLGMANMISLGLHKLGISLVLVELVIVINVIHSIYLVCVNILVILE